MKCPSCSAPFPTPVPLCPNCKLTLRRLDVRFGTLPRHSQFLTDRSGTLPLPAIRELRTLLHLFLRKFPQSLFSVFVMGEVQNGTIAEYTFWLGNRGRFNSLKAVGGQNFDLLLGIDRGAGAAALQAGYGLENYLAEHDLERALARGLNAFERGDIAAGIRDCVEFMIERMRELAKKAENSGMLASGKPVIAAR
jgi:uncharacterized membrane protein YgcG